MTVKAYTPEGGFMGDLHVPLEISLRLPDRLQNAFARCKVEIIYGRGLMRDTVVVTYPDAEPLVHVCPEHVPVDVGYDELVLGVSLYLTGRA